MSLIDMFDNIAGPLNYFDRLAGLFWGLYYRDFGHEFKVLYRRSGGNHHRKEIAKLLDKYGIPTYGQLHDANHMYFRCKKRQAIWADYIMRRAGVAIVGAALNASHSEGTLPLAWADIPKKQTPKIKKPRQPLGDSKCWKPKAR